jgi:hypothetical protein
MLLFPRTGSSSRKPVIKIALCHLLDLIKMSHIAFYDFVRERKHSESMYMTFFPVDLFHGIKYFLELVLNVFCRLNFQYFVHVTMGSDNLKQFVYFSIYLNLIFIRDVILYTNDYHFLFQCKNNILSNFNPKLYVCFNLLSK